MKILMTADVSLNEGDAKAIHVLEVFKNLSKFSDVHLITPPAYNVLYNLIRRASGLAMNILYNIHRLIFNIPLFIKLSCHILKSKEPVVIYSRYWFLGFSLILVSKLFRVPYIVEVNGLAIDEYNELKIKPDIIFTVSRYFISKCEKIIFRFSKRIVAITPALKDQIKGIYNIPAEKIVVIPNGANIDLFKPADQRKVREELKLDHMKSYVCYVGSLSSDEGVEYLIKCAPLILERIQNVRFLIIGDGPLKEELIKLAERTGVADKFIFVGRVSYEDVPKYINASDVCVVYRKPLKESSPLKLYEYMACGKPVVASKISGCEVVKENNTGILVKPECPEELAKGILKLLINEQLREELGRNGMECVVKNYSWEAVARKIVDVCKESLM